MAEEKAGSALDADRLRTDVAKLLGEAPENIDSSANLLDHGLDSIRIMSLVERWREEGAEITPLELAEAPTLASWIEMIGRKTAAG
ncbi:acyl carrier protein [Actinomadura soli]|uniref:Acyl carrier protein n=1 Tax=Actinomadura soli TaxID=2508997 RepID=A0A5C4JJA7_9ACTN|nr:phosphopantetheine-binding protein [Actinomadura soli]TMR06848.1 acyl carrier protein [Actinomadura soli]